MGYKNKGQRVGMGGRGKKGATPLPVLSAAAQVEGAKTRVNNLTGMLFGRLRVIKWLGDELGWLCECTCWNGNHKTVRTNSLLRGKVKSCGCLKRLRSERAAARREARAYANPAGKRGRPKQWAGWLGDEVASRLA